MANYIGKTTEMEYTLDAKIDLKDRKILTVLSRNCRLTPTQIAKQVGLSKEVVLYRMKNLEKKGIIRGYITVMNPVKIGLQIFVVYLQTQNMSQEKEGEFINRLTKHPSTHYIVHGLGKYDFTFDIIASSINEFDKILREILKDFNDYIKLYEIAPVVDVVRYSHLVDSFSEDIKLNAIKYVSDASFMKDLPAEIDYTQDALKIDKTDMAILSQLSENARVQFKELAEKVNVSDDTIKYRIRNLIKKNIILGFLPIINLSMLGYHNHGILMQLNNIEYQEKEKLFQYLKAHSDVFLFLKTSGLYEIALNISVRNNLDLHRFIVGVKQKFSRQIRTIDMFLFIKDYKMAFWQKSVL